MQARHLIAFAAAGLMLGACSTSPDVTRRTIEESSYLTADTGTGETVLAAPNFSVSAVNVVVPRTLTVSEANTFKPRSDIVWREDPLGDRYAQVQTIVADALRAGTEGLNGERAVVLDVELKRFHALTQRTRYTVGGTHEIVFTMVLRDAETGEAITPPRTIMADLPGLGGQAALAAEARGETQKVRISAHLKMVIAQVFAHPIEVYAG